MTFLYTNNELAEREIGKCIPFTTDLKIYKVLRNKLYQEVKDLHNENFKTLKKIVKETLDKGILSFMFLNWKD